MSKRTSVWLAWSLWTIALMAVAAGLMFAWFNHPGNDLSWLVNRAIGAIMAIAFATVGIVIARHRPENLIGWIFVGSGLASALWTFGNRYAEYALMVAPGSLPGGVWMAWAASLLVLPSFWPLVTFLPLIFPDGRLVSRRWRWAAWLAGSAIVMVVVGNALDPNLLKDAWGVDNPVGLGLPGTPVVIFFMVIMGFVLFLGSMLASITCLVLRFRRARGDERQQLKWFAFAIVLLAAAVLGGIPFSERVQGLLNTIGIASFPIAAGVAILKYRLYDIDVIINRTLVYGALTVLLVLVYWVGVVALQYLFQALTGQKSQLAIVASTLAIAALFNPLRRRIQTFIDRRFYRRKYDAAQVLAAFSVVARDEVDLDRLTNELLAVVEETLQPEHVSLWLREPEEQRSKT